MAFSQSQQRPTTTATPAPAAVWRSVQTVTVTAMFLMLLSVLFFGTPITWAAGTDNNQWAKWLSGPLLPRHPQPPSFPCSHPVYCYGDLLHAVQTSKTVNGTYIFEDSKTFVDMPLAHSVSDVLAAFEKLPLHPSFEQVLAFVLANFLEAGSEMVQWAPVDWRENPESYAKIVDTELRRFALNIHKRWNDLGRLFNRTNPCDDCYSSFNLPYPFIVPGGRFREAYYWDSYWVLDGLLLSNMTITARYVLDNFDYMVKKFGFIPNGGRIYYSKRSQPPVFSLMVQKYHQLVQNKTYLLELLPSMMTEYNFWMDKRQIHLDHLDGVSYTLNFFNVATNFPRPESYREDLHLAEGLSFEDQQQLFSELTSGAETGWDYSSRWLKHKNDLSSIQTRNIIPCDLNAILYKVELFLAEVAEMANLTSQAAFMRMQAGARRQAMYAFLWDNATSQWRDYNYVTKQHVEGFFPSNFLPLWADALTEEQRNHGVKQSLLKEIKKQTGYTCGIPTSQHTTEEQWDFPNSWPPLQLFMIEALENLDLAEASTEAERVAQQWLLCNYCGWLATGAEKGGSMFEKYDVTRRGVPGLGGEYGVQEGFGWTNGVVLRLAVRYGASIKLTSCSQS